MSNERGQGCRIHDTAVIGEGVVIGDRVTIGPGAVLVGPVEIEDDCWIGAHTVIGTPPEILGFEHFTAYSERSAGFGVLIERGTVIRELTTVHQGSERPTIVGAHSFIMNRISIEHDCQLGACTIAAAGTALAGHVTLGSGCNLGMNSTVHQRRVVGSGAMVGMGSVITKDIPPFATVFGNPAVLHGANSVGMSRKGHDDAEIDVVASAYAAARLPELAALGEASSSAFTWWQQLSTKPLIG
ncbi:DapH/DapD/GlmU-related protein [Rhodococcus ruber]|uniref:DapH/DapD/GlmU-related protein n=1 Tax=Rhodococcus ruber TaxID=1830 RepID=A0ABT4MA73_9NOCA|nr:DapH/DapD/GlmU-related protein [Rhodococcus ruber]MCZ4516980.1 DapH/DapD/GlmU-related protein [Rhodococcus ruber]